MTPFLTEEQRKEYKRVHKKCKDKHFADRIKSILALDKGHSFEHIAELLMIDDTSVRRWHEQFLEGGIEVLLKDDYRAVSRNFLWNNRPIYRQKKLLTM